ncbi:preprotein translocase subunit SecE [bacterium]|nr:preprotein translocase subunit SecE [bacterium]
MPKLINYLKEVKTESKKINWPTRKQAMRYSLIVIGISFFVAVFLGSFDAIFSFLLRRLIE